MCLGSPAAQHGVVYLHGIDSVSPSSQELTNREVLKHLAEKWDLRIALPRAEMSCHHSVCWGWGGSGEEKTSAITKINAAAEACGLSKKSIGLIGFSSGGYMVAQLFRQEEFAKMKPPVKWAIAAASGLLKGPLEAHYKNLEGRLVFVVGKKDATYDPTQNYYNRLREKSSGVSLIEFEGGHELTKNSMNDALARILE